MKYFFYLMIIESFYCILNNEESEQPLDANLEFLLLIIY
jgi:hypothetical protein